MCQKKTCFQGGYKFFKNISLIKKNGASKIKGSNENVTSMIYESLEPFFETIHFGISILLLLWR